MGARVDHLTFVGDGATRTHRQQARDLPPSKLALSPAGVRLDVYGHWIEYDSFAGCVVYGRREIRQFTACGAVGAAVVEIAPTLDLANLGNGLERELERLTFLRHPCTQPSTSLRRTSWAFPGW